MLHLFTISEGDIMNEPLAISMRPKKISDILGQSHLIGKDKIITNMVKNKKIFSMILYGKPGIGKTTIATAIVNELGLRYRMLNAVINNKKDFDTVVEEAKMYNGLVVIMDEVHRLNKDKQDLLLPYLENGLITFIGMTTSNPYHKINPAIRSRCQLFELNELTTSDVVKGLRKACKSEYLPGIKIDKNAIDYIAKLSGGDMRFAYNLLEVSYYSTDNFNINIDTVKKINSKPVFFSDQNEDGHYDVLSGLQKSIRGSDVNASLHYLARLIESEDLDSIYRRLSVIVYEDIGLANPGMGPKLDAAINACERVGLPEARIPLGTIVTEMALSPKSNSAHIALDLAIEDIKKGNTGNLPKHLRTNSTEYKYPHDYPNSWVKQQYLPDNIKNKKYYIPKNNKYEDNLNKLHREMKGEK
jgi:putative ATPase